MTLDKEQKKEIKKIVKLWQKDELLAPEFHEQLKEVEGINWANQKEMVEEEVDQIVSSSTGGRAPVARIMAFLLLVIASVIVLGVDALSIWGIYIQGEQLIAKSDQLTDRVATVSTQIDGINEEINRQTTTINELDAAIATIQEMILELQPPLMTPEPDGEIDTTLRIPVPAMVISGSVTTTNLGQMHHGSTEFILYSGNGEQRWEKEIRFSPNETGEFTLIVPVTEDQQFYRLDINPPSETYIDSINNTGEWQIITDPISGLIAGLEYLQVFTTTAVLSGVQVSLTRTPIVSMEPIFGSYTQGNLRTAPFETADTLFDITGNVSPTVTVLGQWVNGQWQLVCCQETSSEQGDIIDKREKRYFWSGTTQQGEWLVGIPADQEDQVAQIYLPVGVEDITNPLSGWASETVDGLAIFASRPAPNTRPVTLEWRIDNIEGWFKLEVWVPRGSQPAIYQAAVLQAGSEQPLTPLSDSTEVIASLASTLSGFRSIGTYRLDDESTVIVRLSTEYEDVKAGFIRLTKLDE